MGNIRNITESDIPQLRKIHSQFFQNEFTFADFCQSWLTNFVITDDNNDIISAGAIRPIMEIVAVTNYEKSPRIRRSALYDMLTIAQYVLRDTNFTQLHAFIQDEKWLGQLQKAGFRRCVGIPVFIDMK